jgi:hypothetical protein
MSRNTDLISGQIMASSDTFVKMGAIVFNPDEPRHHDAECSAQK